MKEKIIEKAATMFLSFGFKSVTMDDIADELGISKKTIYQYFTTKPELIKNATLFVFEEVTSGIDKIRHQNINPIEELFAIEKFVYDYLKTDSSSTIHQLQKYYPKIYAASKQHHLEKVEEIIGNNLKSGIKQGFYRKEIDTDVIGRFYFSGVMSCQDVTLFPSQKFEKKDVFKKFLEYHLRGIGTPKGIEVLENLLKTH